MYWFILVVIMSGLMVWWRSPQFPVEALIYRFAFVAMIAYIAGFLDSRRSGSKDRLYGNIVNQPEPEVPKEY